MARRPSGPDGVIHLRTQVLFAGGYFCADGPDGRGVQLVLALPELDTLVQHSSSVVGPFTSKAQMGGAC